MTYRPFDGSTFEPEYTLEDWLFDLQYEEENKILDHLAHEEYEEDRIQENYTIIESEEQEIQHLIEMIPC